MSAGLPEDPQPSDYEKEVSRGDFWVVLPLILLALGFTFFKLVRRFKQYHDIDLLSASLWVELLPWILGIAALIALFALFVRKCFRAGNRPDR